MRIPPSSSGSVPSSRVPHRAERAPRSLWGRINAVGERAWGMGHAPVEAPVEAPVDRRADGSRYDRPVVLLVGDSLVQRSFEPGGWGARLVGDYARSADVVLRGYSGYNTRWVKDLMKRRPGLFPPSEHVALLVVLLVRAPRLPCPERPRDESRVPKLVSSPSWFCDVRVRRRAPHLIAQTTNFHRRSPYLSGANDASRPEGHKRHYSVPVHEYKRNLRWIASQYITGPEGPVVVICTPPPVDEPKRLHLTTKLKGMHPDLLDRSEAHTASYAGAAAEVGAELGVAVADLHGGLKGHGGNDWAGRLLSDGLHFTPDGQERVHQIIEETVRNWKNEGDVLGIGMSSLRAHSAVLPWDSPPHDEIVGTNKTNVWDREGKEGGAGA